MIKKDTFFRCYKIVYKRVGSFITNIVWISTNSIKDNYRMVSIWSFISLVQNMKKIVIRFDNVSEN